MITNKQDDSYYQQLRNKLNEIHKELQAAPTEFKQGYWHSVGSILNAYREADISFDKACELLAMRTDSDD